MDIRYHTATKKPYENGVTLTEQNPPSKYYYPFKNLICFTNGVNLFILKNYIKDSKWGRKCIYMNCANCNGSPQQNPLWQFPFTNETKPCF